ncbi:MAG: hypothetical protein ACI4TK_03475 [Agathobacter sp.]
MSLRAFDIEMVNVKAKFGKRIAELLEEELGKMSDGLAKEIVKRGYALEEELPHDDALFIGMNPAFTKKDIHGSSFYHVETADNTFFKELLQFSYDTLGYSNPSHHDLLFLRHTDQNEVIDQFGNTDFWNEQLAISKEIIAELSPKLIVVLNAGVRELFANMFSPDENYLIDPIARNNWPNYPCELRYDESLGVYRFIINGKSTPVLFSSMLSGQRALDKGSKRSLQWHIKYILDRI